MELLEMWSLTKNKTKTTIEIEANNVSRGVIVFWCSHVKHSHLIQ